jgi:fermentation-respiration switch protein FrsA (DUF1100 family)
MPGGNNYIKSKTPISFLSRTLMASQSPTSLTFISSPCIVHLAPDSSPITYVIDWSFPVLLIHGDDDRNVPFGGPVDLVEALRKKCWI